MTGAGFRNQAPVTPWRTVPALKPPAGFRGHIRPAPRSSPVAPASPPGDYAPESSAPAYQQMPRFSRNRRCMGPTISLHTSQPTKGLGSNSTRAAIRTPSSVCSGMQVAITTLTRGGTGLMLQYSIPARPLGVVGRLNYSIDGAAVRAVGTRDRHIVCFYIHSWRKTARI